MNYPLENAPLIIVLLKCTSVFQSLHDLISNVITYLDSSTVKISEGLEYSTPSGRNELRYS